MGMTATREFEGQLNKELMQQVVKKGSPFGGVAEIGKNEGRGAEAAVISVGSVAAIVFVGSVTASAWGSYLLYKDSIIHLSEGMRPSADIGHAGEWAAQCGIYTFLFFREVYQVMLEKDYARMKKVYSRQFANLPEGAKVIKIYDRMLRNLMDIGHSCFFPKNAFRQRLDALEITKEVQSSEIESDRALKEIYRAICRDVEKELALKRYFQRSVRGLKEIGRSHGRLRQCLAGVVAATIPLFFSVQSALSFIGSGFVAADVAEGVEETDAIGHVGEWPANGLGFALFAKLSNDYAVKNRGDLALARDVVVRHLNDVQDKTLRKRVKALANDELQKLAGRCMFSLPPTAYRV